MGSIRGRWQHGVERVGFARSQYRCRIYQDFYLDRHALEFEKQFRGLSRRKRITLYLGVVGIMVVTGIVFAIIGTEYRGMFPPPGK